MNATQIKFGMTAAMETIKTVFNEAKGTPIRKLLGGTGLGTAGRNLGTTYQSVAGMAKSGAARSVIKNSVASGLQYTGKTALSGLKSWWGGGGAGTAAQMRAAQFVRRGAVYGAAGAVGVGALGGMMGRRGNRDGGQRRGGSMRSFVTGASALTGLAATGLGLAERVKKLMK